MKKPLLNCDLYDYLEIACLYRIEVGLLFKNGNRKRGVPVTTGANANLGEYLVFRQNEENDPVQIPLFSLESMQALVANPHFSQVDFIFG